MKIIPPFSALVSWESYEYQGHIALYVTLKMINELVHKSIDLKDYELQIEGEEDFSILKGNRYLSLHQVKAGTVALKTKDKFAFIIALLEDDNALGYFHINKNEKIPTDFCKKTIKHIDFLLKHLSKRVVIKANRKVKNYKYNHIVCEEIVSTAEKASVYSLLNYVLNNRGASKNDVGSVKAAVKDLSKKLKDFQLIISGVLNDPHINEYDKKYLRVYDDRFDTNREIRLKAADIIIKLLSVTNPEYKIFLTNKYAMYVYDRLLLFMKGKITQHLEASRKGKCLISFNDLLNEATRNYHDEMDTTEYHYFLVLQRLSEVYAAYPQLKRTSCTALSCKECSSKKSCNLSNEIERIFKASSNQQVNIIYNLLLFEPQKGESNNLPSDLLISHLMCDALREIKAMKLSSKKIIQAVNDNVETYRLTLDESWELEEIQEKLQAFIEEEKNRTILYEADVLVTERFTGQEIVFEDDKILILGDKELKELKKHNIKNTGIKEMKEESNRPKVMRLIDLNTAKGELI